MVGLKLLYRFDDICPTMNWNKWDRIEAVLDETGIRGILAIVPDNRDPALQVDRANPRFWERARQWQEKGHIIGLHGYQHICNIHGESLVPIRSSGEFLSMDAEEQGHKLKQALCIFKEQRIKADVWVAPRHAFNVVTLEALKANDLTVISDGFGYRPWIEADGMVWIPQQLGQPRRIPPWGVWTICLHSNGMGDTQIAHLEQHMWRYREYSKSVKLECLVHDAEQPTLLDRAFASSFRWIAGLKRMARTG